MKIVFVSNYFNHHQKPFCDALYYTKDIEFNFIATTSMREERRKMGYDKISIPSYVIQSDASEKAMIEAKKLINEADAVICGLPPRELLKKRIRNSKVIFYYTERPMKTAPSYLQKLKLKVAWKTRASRKKPIYLLAAGAYTASDYSELGVFENKAYKWGYFPETITDVDLQSSKENGSILWCGRLLAWKHPMDAVQAALNLKKEGYSFKLKIIGNGEEEERIKKFILKNSLSDHVILSDFLSPYEVRKEMEKAEIYLFTSDGGEGWGAVLNESMNSGCAVLASDKAGASRFLIKDSENGFIYESENVNSLTEKLKFLLDNPEKRKKLSINAYKTITEEWNAKTAAKRFIILAKAIINGSPFPELFPNGPCSKA
ncbi:MAG: glycosyltransferase [Ruminococcaceae bacterium]|nr:glycosyltransferase [Oscillospiraceae bacterium]